MNDTIKITAQILDAERCQFNVDRPLGRFGGSRQFVSRHEAGQHPLAEMLFGIDGVTGVQISGPTVTVAKEGDATWKEVGAQVGKATRAYLKSDALSAAAPPAIVASSSMEEQIRVRVTHLLDTEINPGVASHGGRISLVDVKGSTVYIQMSGGCQGCGSATATLKQGVERTILQSIPEVTAVLDATDHGEGKNPYYAPAK